MAYTVSSGRALEDFSGKNQDAASFNRFAIAPMYCSWHWLVYSLESKCRH